MPEAVNGGTTLFYDTMGDPNDPTILLVMGLGAQMVAFREEFCQLLVRAGFHIVRFDNRDVGLSSKTTHLGFKMAPKSPPKPLFGPYKTFKAAKKI